MTTKQNKTILNRSSQQLKRAITEMKNKTIELGLKNLTADK